MAPVFRKLTADSTKMSKKVYEFVLELRNSGKRRKVLTERDNSKDFLTECRESFLGRCGVDIVASEGFDHEEEIEVNVDGLREKIQVKGSGPQIYYTYTKPDIQEGLCVYFKQL